MIRLWRGNLQWLLLGFLISGCAERGERSEGLGKAVGEGDDAGVQTETDRDETDETGTPGVTPDSGRDQDSVADTEHTAVGEHRSPHTLDAGTAPAVDDSAATEPGTTTSGDSVDASAPSPVNTSEPIPPVPSDAGSETSEPEPMDASGSQTDPTDTSEPTDPPLEPDCTNTAEQQADIPSAGFPGFLSTASFSDLSEPDCASPTLHCLETTSDALRFWGVAAAAGNEFRCWGAGYIVNMAITDDDGSEVTPWDAASLGIQAVRLRLTGIQGGPNVRVHLVQAGLPLNAAFVHGGGTSDIDTDTERVFRFSDFTLPSWALDAHPELEGAQLDASELEGLQIMVVTSPTSEQPFDFTLSHIEWLDSDLQVVEVTPLSTADAGTE